MRNGTWHPFRLSGSLKPVICEQAGYHSPLDVILISICDCFKADENKGSVCYALHPTHMGSSLCARECLASTGSHLLCAAGGPGVLLSPVQCVQAAAALLCCSTCSVLPCIPWAGIQRVLSLQN